LQPNFDETVSDCLFWQYLGQVRIWVMSGQKLGHQVKSYEILAYTQEATFATGFWWNLVRVFVLTISRPISNMGHVGSKTRSPGKILWNACLHFIGHICDPFWWHFVKMIVLTISRPISDMCHVSKKTRSPGQILENSFTNITFKF